MKPTIKFFLFFALLLPVAGYGQVPNLDKLPKKERDSILFAVSKAAILKHGPSYIHDGIKPEIIYGGIIPEGPRKGKYHYVVKYPDIPKFEGDDNQYGAEVGIWNETGEVYEIFFTGWWCPIEIKESSKTRSGGKEEIEVRPPIKRRSGSVWRGKEPQLD